MFHTSNIDKNFRDFLRYTSDTCRISGVFFHDQYLVHAGDYIKVEKEVGTISFIPKDKLTLDHGGFEDTKFRVKTRIGRFVRKFIKKDTFSYFNITEEEVEEYVNLYKSYFSEDPSKFVVISGPELLKWYLESNYFILNGRRVGTIWNSCMRQSDRNRFLKIYGQNPDKVKLLVYLEGDKVRARALLWDDCQDHSSGKKYKVMDRIYSSYDHDVASFKSWAKSNGYISKYTQTSRSELLFDVDGGVRELLLSVHLDNHIMEHYPYLDTFKFYNKENGTFSNWNNSFSNFCLVQSDGCLVRRSSEVEDEVEDDELVDDVWVPN